jgi:hypothetical protein
MRRVVALSCPIVRTAVRIIGGNDEKDTLNVFVPRLGAYTVNKAASFSKRLDVRGGSNPKRAKDLVVERDGMTSIEAALADIRGYITDLGDLLKDRGL